MLSIYFCHCQNAEQAQTWSTCLIPFQFIVHVDTDWDLRAVFSICSFFVISGGLGWSILGESLVTESSSMFFANIPSKNISVQPIIKEYVFDCIYNTW